ncbi:MAG: DUF3365 domain-containing protein [Anaerolineales bacterium]|nr:DUF3365 domain-containing protein [Anaerolineales bacterium]
MIKSILSTKSSTLINVVTGLFFFATGILVIFLVNQTMRRQALEEANAKARILLDRNMAVHRYFTEILKPNLFEWSEPFRTDEYFDPSWMSSTYAVREIDKYFQSFSPEKYKIQDAAINARSPENEADAFDKSFLESLKNDPSLETHSSVRTIDGKQYLVVLRAGEVLHETCLRCHSEPELAPAGLVNIYGAESSFHREDEIGDIVSAISIRIPLYEAYGAANRFTLQLSVLLLFVLVILFIIILWLQKTFVFTPLDKIRIKALQISSGVQHLGEEAPVPASRDLSELAKAFNAMSTSLCRSRDELEERVLVRTSELAAAKTCLEFEISERIRAEKELQDYSERLEDMVQERTRELGAAQEKLIRKEKLSVLGQLAGGIAHELRNPLMSIKNVSFLLGLSLESFDKDIQESLGILNCEINSAEQIINSLLDFARTGAPNKKTVDINREIDLVLAQMSIPESPKIEFVRHFEKSLPPIMADRDQLAIVFRNLIINAIQAMPAGGQLVIRTFFESRDIGDKLAKSITVSISDTGIGISKENIVKLFDPLYTANVRGIGLGLSLVKLLVEGHGGTITASSDGIPGRGASLTLKLPATEKVDMRGNRP